LTQDHNPLTCNHCKSKEEKTISEWKRVNQGTGLFSDFDEKKKKENKNCQKSI